MFSGNFRDVPECRLQIIDRLESICSVLNNTKSLNGWCLWFILDMWKVAGQKLTFQLTAN